MFKRLMDYQLSPKKTIVLAFVLLVSLLSSVVITWPLTNLTTIILPFGFGGVTYLFLDSAKELRKLKLEKV